MEIAKETQNLLDSIYIDQKTPKGRTLTPKVGGSRNDLTGWERTPKVKKSGKSIKTQGRISKTNPRVKLRSKRSNKAIVTPDKMFFLRKNTKKNRNMKDQFYLTNESIRELRKPRQLERPLTARQTLELAKNDNMNIYKSTIITPRRKTTGGLNYHELMDIQTRVKNKIKRNYGTLFTRESQPVNTTRRSYQPGQNLDQRPARPFSSYVYLTPNQISESKVKILQKKSKKKIQKKARVTTLEMEINPELERNKVEFMRNIENDEFLNGALDDVDKAEINESCLNVLMQDKRVRQLIEMKYKDKEDFNKNRATCSYAQKMRRIKNERKALKRKPRKLNLSQMKDLHYNRRVRRVDNPSQTPTITLRRRKRSSNRNTSKARRNKMYNFNSFEFTLKKNYTGKVAGDARGKSYQALNVVRKLGTNGYGFMKFGLKHYRKA